MRVHTLLISFVAVASMALGARAVTTITRQQILDEAQHVADAQLQALGERESTDWTWAVMEAGYGEFARVSPKGNEYTSALTRLAGKANWTLPLRAKNPFHADDFCIGQTFMDLDVNPSEPAHLASLTKRGDALVDHLNQPADLSHLTFFWCDALFMAPPVLTRMSTLTGDRKYIDAMDKEFWRTTELLYDRHDHLFYRDARFLHQQDANGSKIFWSRGNGWVLAGLARVLQYMPADYPSRSKYELLFKEMATTLSALQSTDGTWSASLLDPQLFGGPETSGTALFTYAMAWGINHKLLDRATYFPIVSKAWNVLLNVRRPDGLPGFVQSVGYQPGAVKPGDTQLYATGAYLLAATELQMFAPLIVADPAPSTQPVARAANAPAQPTPGAKAFARYVPERMDDIAWENDRIAHRIYGPALEHNPKEHSGSGIDVWVKSVREPVINEWYRSNKYHINRGTGLDFYEVGLSRGDGGLGVWDNGKLYNSKDWVDHKILDLGPNQCGFDLSYAPWDVNGRKVWEHRTMTLKAGSNLDRIQSTIESDKPGEIIVGIGLAKRSGAGGKLMQNKELGVMSYWQPPEKDGTIGVGVSIDPKMIVSFDEDKLNYLVLIKVTAGKPFEYYAGACWDKGLDFKTADQWETYLKDFKRD